MGKLEGKVAIITGAASPIGATVTRAMVAEGAVAVDGEIETRTRRKLRCGNSVRVADEEVLITAAASDAS